MHKPRQAEMNKKPICNETYRPSAIFQILIAALLIFVIGCAADNEQRLREASAAHQMGVAYLRDRQSMQALQSLVKAEQLNPTSAEYKNTLGIAYMVRKEYSTARLKFEEAVALDPTDSEAWNNLGALHLDRERYTLAVTAFDKALENKLYVTRELALGNKGWALYKLGRMAEARASLERAIAIEPTYPLAHLNLGIIFQDMNRHLEALDSFDRTLDIYPGNAKAHLHRGISLFRMDKRDEAKLAFEEASELDRGGDVGKSALTYLNHLQ